MARALEAFQAAWEVVPVISVVLKGTGKHSYLCWTAVLEGGECGTGEAPVLGWASVNMRTGPAMDTDAALLALLYELDKDVYRREQRLTPPLA